MTRGATKSDDFAVRCAVVDLLIASGTPRRDIRHELTFDTSSADGRADIVVLSDAQLIGVELKSGRDTIDRLKTQTLTYEMRFDHQVLVYDAAHELKFRAQFGYVSGWHAAPIRFNSGVPEWDSEGRYWNGVGVLSRPNDSSHRKTGHVSSRAILEMLWRPEVRQIDGSKSNRFAIIDSLCESMPLRELRPLVVGQLRSRVLNRWEESFWRRYDARTEATGKAA